MQVACCAAPGWVARTKGWGVSTEAHNVLEGIKLPEDSREFGFDFEKISALSLCSRLLLTTMRGTSLAKCCKPEEVDKIGPTTDWEFTTAGPGSCPSPSVDSAIGLRFLKSQRKRSFLRDLVLPESSASDMLDVQSMEIRQRLQ